jgi:hypothetical protein
MGVDISQGGGGGGITIETDPTALKKASNLADLTSVEDAKQNLNIHQYGGSLSFSNGSDTSNIQIGSSVVNSSSAGITTSWEGMPGLSIKWDGITFADGTTQTTAAAGSGNSLSVTGFSEWNVENSAYLSTTGAYAGAVGTGNPLGDSVNIVCETQTIDSYRKVGLIGTTTINEGTYNASFMFGWYPSALNENGAYGWKVDPCLIFPDGTVQNTAYTGGGGGGVALNATQQRYADAIAALTATPTVMEAAGETLIQVQWAVSFQYNNNTLYTEYPKFLDAMASNYNIAIYIGDYYPVTYIDSTYIVGSLNVLNPLYGYIYVAVTDSVNGGGFTDSTTTALSFPAGFVNWSPA